MKRKIRFRNWTGKKMENWETTKYAFPEVAENKGNHLMQYTGLRDKNEKRIYEGDILQYTTNTKKNYNLEVIFGSYVDGEGFYDLMHTGWYTENIDKNGNYKKFTLIDIHSKSKIIGNIHENPELL